MPVVHGADARPGPAEAADPVGGFFTALGRQRHVATFEQESATLRFDVADGDKVSRWHVRVDDGTVTVSRRIRRADAVVGMRGADAEGIVTGRLNAQAAMLRGLITCEGSVAALMMFQRCLPGPPDSTGRVAPITSEQVMAQRRP